MSARSDRDPGSQPHNLPAQTSFREPFSDQDTRYYSRSQAHDPDVSNNGIQLLQNLVDRHLAHFQQSSSHPHPSPTDKDKFLRLSTSTLGGDSFTSVHRKPLLHDDREFLSSYTYLVIANHPPQSPQPPTNLSNQSNMPSTHQPDLTLNDPVMPSTGPSTTAGSTPNATSRTVSVSSQAPPPPPKADLESQPSPEWKPQRTEYAIMLTLAVASLLVALDSDILVASLPALSTHLNGSTTEAFWAGSAYLLPYAVVQPFLACLSDIFGRRPLLLASLALFLIGSLPCALANDMPTLLAGRVIQGIGGGGIVALAQAVYTDIVPLRQRPKWFGIVLLAWAVGTMIGPVVGGAFTDMSEQGWRWCFWINFPLGGVALALSWWLVRLRPASSPLTLSQKLRTVDYGGGVLFVGSVTSALVAVSWGGNPYAWSHWRTLVPLLLGFAGLLGFAAYERYIAKYPFVQRSVFPSWSAVILFVLAFLYGVVLFMAVYYICFYFSSIKLVSATTAGAYLIPALALALPSSIVCGLLMTRWGKFRWAIWAGHALEGLAYGLLIRFDASTPTAEWAVTLCLVGLGSGMSLSSINFGVQTTTASDRDSAAATVMYAFMRSIGMCVGVSIGSTIFQNVATTALADKGLDDEIATHAEAFVYETLRFMAEGEEMRRDVVDAFVQGLRVVFIVMTALKAAALLMSLAVGSRSMDRELDGRYRVAQDQDQDREKEERP